MGQHRNWSRASRATFAWGWQLTPNKCGHGPRSLAAMSAMLGGKHRCIARSMRSASPVGSVIIGPRGAPRTGLRDTLLGPPGAGPPGPRRGGRGKFPGPGRAGPRAPGAPPGDPAGDPSGTPVWGPILGPVWGPYIYIFILLDPPSGGPIWGALCAPPGGPRGAPRPGGQKSAHFFGYLITLPVGTVWALFFPPPGQGGFWDSLGDSRLGECL